MTASPDTSASPMRIRLDLPGTQNSPSSTSSSPPSQNHRDRRNTMKRQIPGERLEDRQPPKKRGPSSRPPRASQACRSCAASKVRCDDLEICRRCLKRSIPCVRPTQLEQGPQMVSTEAPRAQPNLSTRTSVDGDDSCILESAAQNAEAQQSPSTIEQTNLFSREGDRSQLIDDSYATFAFPNSPISLGNSVPSQLFGDIHSVDHLAEIPLTGSTEWLKNASFHAEFDASFLLPLPFVDFPGYSEDCLMQELTDSTPKSFNSLPSEDKTIFEEAVTAYRTTLGSWKPTHEDYLAAARSSLYVPLEEQARLVENLGYLNADVIDGCLSSVRRDEIIVAMIDGTQTTQSLLAVRMFPSAEILDKLLKVFLTDQETSASAFVHISTFDPSTCSLYLLIACIVAGAVKSPSSSVRTFGLGLFDVLRLHLATSAERENILTRDLSYVQSLMILSETGLWSGDKRISEISDTLSELAASMLRHAGRFTQHTYVSPTFILDGPQNDLGEAWKRWAQQESLKRTVFQHLLQCTQRSVIRNMPAQISPLEISTPLPEGCRFWFAKTASECRSLYQNQHTYSDGPRTTIIDCLSNIQSIDLPSSQAYGLSRLSLTYSFLSMLIEDRRRSIVFKQRDSGWSFTDISRSPGASHLVFLFAELKDIIERHPSDTRSAVVTFMVEFNMLYSATPRYLRDSLLTNGKQASPSQAFSQLHEWQESRSSRSAIWYAGQLIRACRMIAPKERTDFHLFGVYHALLCIWTYWTATRKSPPDLTGTNRRAVHSPQILLDGPESLESQRWISHDSGVPYLTRSPKANNLCNTVPELVPVNANDLKGTIFKLPLVDLLNECFLHKITGKHIPILQHASLVLYSLERL